jgi:hypothetical protein
VTEHASTLTDAATARGSSSDARDLATPASSRTALPNAAASTAPVGVTPPDLRLSGGPYVSCPLCHTTHVALTEAALAAGGGWCCAICSAQWDAVRVGKVAAYRAWVREHGPASRPL